MAWTVAPASTLPAPDQAARSRWTQTLNVTVRGMTTADVIAAGFASPPSVVTGAASNIGPTSVTVAGTVNPHGLATTYLFEYGKTTSYGSKTASKSAGSGTSSLAVSTTIASLSPGTTYHYRIVATSAKGTTVGADQSFTTSGGSSRVQILAPTAFVSPHGVLGVGLGCFRGPFSCNMSLTLSRGKTVYASRRVTLGAESGGFAHIALSSSAQRALLGHYRQPVAVRVTIVTTGGQRISQVIYLVRFF